MKEKLPLQNQFSLSFHRLKEVHIFFFIIPKLKEPQSCARSQIEEKTIAFPNLLLKTICTHHDPTNAWVFARRVLLGKYLVHSELQ